MTDPGYPPRGIRGLFEWLSKFYEAWKATRYIRSPGMRMRQTPSGTSLTPDVQESSGGTGAIQWKGQWADGSYLKDDIVICEAASPTDEEADGYEYGTFIANDDVVAGDLPPGHPVETATATATTDGSAVTAIAVTYGGDGYASAPAVTIGGPGSGATAHAVLTGGVVTSIVIDTAGTGYTSATVTIGDPTKVQKWDHFAGPREAFALRPVAPARSLQKIRFNAGRDTSQKPFIVLELDYTDGSQGAIQIDIATLVSLAPSGYRVIKPTLWDVCVEGVDKQAVFLSTDPFTPP